VGCLTRDIVDDGRGSARSHCFQHSHEKETGRTSAISVQVMGMDAAGTTLRTAETSRVRHFQAVRAQSKRIITFVDLAGHEKYLKSAWPARAHGPSHALVPPPRRPSL
jgi:GTPase